MLRRVLPFACSAGVSGQCCRCTLLESVKNKQSTNHYNALTQTQRSIYDYKFGHPPLTTSFESQSATSSPVPTLRNESLTSTNNRANNIAIDNSSSSSSSSSSSNSVTSLDSGKIEVTKMHNGARIITHQMNGPMSSIGAYILAGPVFDPAQCPGVAALMHLALTTSNFNNSLFQLDRNIRSIGASEVHFEKYKHYLGIRIDVRADRWRSHVNPREVYKLESLNNSSSPSSTSTATGAKSIIPHFSHNTTTTTTQASQEFKLNVIQDNIFTCLAAPRFHESDIERFRDTVDNQLKEMKWQAPAMYAVQMLETIAFYREPLGNPRFVPELNNSNISNKVLLDQYARYIIPEHVVIAGVNTDHEALVAEYENTPFQHSSSAPHHAQALSLTQGKLPFDVQNEMEQYTGGERLDYEERAKDMGTRPDMENEIICAIGWLGYGRDSTMLVDYAASMVVKQYLDMILENDLPFSEDELHRGNGICSFYEPYHTAGLIGVTLTAAPEDAVKMATDTIKQLHTLRSHGMTLEQLQVAQHRAAIYFLNTHTDNIRDYCDYLGTSLRVDHNSTVQLSVQEVIEAIKQVSVENVKRIVETMFSHPTSLYGHGDVLTFPSLRQLGL